MCSVEEEGEVYPEKKAACGSDQEVCMKCSSEKPVVVVRGKDPLCRPCFMTYCIHKFRMSFGKSRLIRDQEAVLLMFSGGQASSAMVHLIQEGKSERAKRKLRFIPTLVFIDELDICTMSDEDKVRIRREIEEKLTATGMSYIIIHLSQVFSEKLRVETNASNYKLTNHDTSPRQQESHDVDALNDLQADFQDKSWLESATEKLQRCFINVKKLTSKEAILKELRSTLMRRLATSCGVQKVLSGETATRTAVSIISDMAQGRGAHLPFQTGFADKRHEDVMFLRPLREFTLRELAVYNRLNHVMTVSVPQLDTMAQPMASIGRLTEEFVTGLQEEYPNTVYTICRTGEKLDLIAGDCSKELGVCALCQAPLDTAAVGCTAVASHSWSQQLLASCQAAEGLDGSQESKSTPAHDQPAAAHDQPAAAHDQPAAALDQPACQGCSCGVNKARCETEMLTSTDLKESLCYGCRLIIRDMKDTSVLPASVMHSAKQNKIRKLQRDAMKNLIQDCLLEEED